jgi:hypothetical protein
MNIQQSKIFHRSITSAHMIQNKKCFFYVQIIKLYYEAFPINNLHWQSSVNEGIKAIFDKVLPYWCITNILTFFVAHPTQDMNCDIFKHQYFWNGSFDPVMLFISKWIWLVLLYQLTLLRYCIFEVKMKVKCPKSIFRIFTLLNVCNG